MRHPRNLLLVITILFITTIANAQEAITMLQDDLVFGVGQEIDSIEWARGPKTENGAESVDIVWEQPFIQSVEFDNLNGVSHNPQGNLLGVNFGRRDDGGQIYNLATCKELVDAQLIGETTGLGGNQLDMSRLGGISVSPDNTKVAVSGYDTGTLIVYDYQAGNCEGTGASLSNARSAPIMGEFATQGTGWLDNSTAIGFTSSAELVSVNVDTLESKVLASYDDPGKRSVFTDLEYNPLISPYIYGSYGGFEDTTENKIFVIDPRNDFALVEAFDFSESINTIREIAFDSEGNLYVSQFSESVHMIPNASDPATLKPNSSVIWYEPFIVASFSGLDVAAGVTQPDGAGGDFNENGQRDPGDLDLLTDAMLANDLAFDLNGDGTTDIADREMWVEELTNTFFGDSDFNGEFNSSDFVAVFSAAKYETGAPATWTEGDWNGDKVFDSSDFVTAFQGAGYENGPRDGGIQVVPEPSSVLLLLTGMLMIRRRPSR